MDTLVIPLFGECEDIDRSTALPTCKSPILIRLSFSCWMVHIILNIFMFSFHAKSSFLALLPIYLTGGFELDLFTYE